MSDQLNASLHIKRKVLIFSNKIFLDSIGLHVIGYLHATENSEKKSRLGMDLKCCVLQRSMLLVL